MPLDGVKNIVLVSRGSLPRRLSITAEQPTTPLSLLFTFVIQLLTTIV